MYIKFLRGDGRALWQDPQAKSLVVFVLVVALIMAVWLVPHLHDSFGHAFRSSLFHVVSVVTTTGFATTDYTLWGPFVIGIFFMLMFVGGCAGSTAGSIKIYRHQVITVVVRTQLLRLLGPHRVAFPRYAGKPVPPDVPSSVLAFIALFFVLIGVFTVALTAFDLDLVTALSASATAMANVGPGMGPIIGPAGNFQSLPDGAKWLLGFEMLLGRLEIFTLLLMLDPEFWRR
jgi:trk system potassium uptake protein TrkH